MRAINVSTLIRESLREELAAINSYEVKISAIEDEEAKKLLQHNADEEREHVSMLMQWLLKNDPVQKQLWEAHD